MFTLIDLPYLIDALEPVISARTLTFHHGKHLQGYVDNLNKLIAGTPYEGLSLEEIVVAASRPDPEPVEGPARKAIFNNAGQILNHNLYFTQFRPAVDRSVPELVERSVPEPVERSVPEPVEGPTGALKARIESQWGSLAAFQAAFVTAGATLFGSGWVWLQADAAGALTIGQYPGADNPAAHGLKPLLTFDVWEHAYYLDYQNRRPAHLEALWGIVDWGVVEARYGQ